MLTETVPTDTGELSSVHLVPLQLPRLIAFFPHKIETPTPMIPAAGEVTAVCDLRYKHFHSDEYRYELNPTSPMDPTWSTPNDTTIPSAKERLTYGLLLAIFPEQSVMTAKHEDQQFRHSTVTSSNAPESCLAHNGGHAGSERDGEGREPDSPTRWNHNPYDRKELSQPRKFLTRHAF